MSDPGPVHEVCVPDAQLVLGAGGGNSGTADSRPAPPGLHTARTHAHVQVGRYNIIHVQVIGYFVLENWYIQHLYKESCVGFNKPNRLLKIIFHITNYIKVKLWHYIAFKYLSYFSSLEMSLV